MLSKYKSILSKYASLLSKYTRILWKYKSIHSEYKGVLSNYITQVYFQSTKVYSGSTKVYRGENPKARLLRVLFDSIDFLALFGVYAGIILLFLFNCAKSFLVEHWADKRVQKVDLGGGEYICIYIYIYIYICVHLPL